MPAASALHLHADDDVLIALRQLLPGETVAAGISVRDPIPPGHKLAACLIRKGSPLRRYGQIIGVALADIEAGRHVHAHNLGMGEFAREAGAWTPPAAIAPNLAAPRATFLGYRRANGKVGTRNYLAVIPTVNCSATVARAIADHFSPERLAAWPGVDGVLALPHALGCGLDTAGEGMQLLRRTLVGYARHPNFIGVLFVGLGCEQNQVAPLVELVGAHAPGMLRHLTMQGEGGTRAAIARGIAEVREMLAAAGPCKREPVSVEHLIVGLNCGGSDGYSGITANPALGFASDLLVAQGATTVLSETPELYGAEHLLTRRAAAPEVAAKLLERIEWWREYTRRNGGEMDNNPSVGNKAGGLTTILEKSLGAVAKGGTSPLAAVYRYAEAIEARGFVFMDTPGYDPVSVTGQAAGGAQIVCFTTGRGSAFGCAGVPTLKLASNSALFERMRDDMDVNCGDVLDGTPLPEVGRRIFDAIVRHASGEPVRSEALGYGQHEFLPWQVGAVM